MSMRYADKLLYAAEIDDHCLTSYIEIENYTTPRAKSDCNCCS